MTQGGGFFLELDGTQFKKELKQLHKLYTQTLKQMEAQGFTGRAAQGAAKKTIVDQARSVKGVGLGTGTEKGTGFGGYGKRASGLWVKGKGLKDAEGNVIEKGIPSRLTAMSGRAMKGGAVETSQITKANIDKMVDLAVTPSETRGKLPQALEDQFKQRAKVATVADKHLAKTRVIARKTMINSLLNQDKAYTADQARLTREAEQAQKASAREQVKVEATRKKAQDGFYKSNSKANQQVVRQEQVTTQTRERAVNKIRNQVQASQDMIRSERELGRASGVSASGIQRHILALEKLRGATALATGDKTRYVQSINVEIVALQKLQAQQLNSTSQMVFMAGASAGVQKGIRNVGAAAQGSMLAMSMMNGDVMGLAFSLIFLQFAANLPVALGFGAIALGGALAFKAIKKILDERKEIEKIGNSFFLITGSVQAGSLAFQRAEAITKDLGLATKEQKELNKALATSMSEMRRRGIEPTTDALKVVIAEWALLIANTERGDEDFTKALEGSVSAAVKFAETGIANIREIPMSLEEAAKRGEYALAFLAKDSNLSAVSLGKLKEAAAELGIEIPKELNKIADNTTLEGIEALRIGGARHDLWEMSQADNIESELKGLIEQLQETDGEAVVMEGSIGQAFINIGITAAEQLGTGGVVAKHGDEFGVTTGKMVIAADLATAAALNAMRQYALMAQEYSSGPLGSYNFLESLEDSNDIVEKVKKVKRVNTSSPLHTRVVDEHGNITTTPIEDDPFSYNTVTPAFDEQDLLGINNAPIINITVTGNNVNNDQELAKEIEGALTRGTNWAPAPFVGI